jgi:hypothetical protein
MPTITVEITATKEVTYKQIVEMLTEDYEVVKDLSGDDLQEWLHEKGKLKHNMEYRVVEKWINPREVYDARDEFTNVSIIAVPDSSKQE